MAVSPQKWNAVLYFSKDVNDVNQNTAGRVRTARFSVDRGDSRGVEGVAGMGREEDNKTRERKKRGKIKRKRLSSRSECAERESWTAG